MICMRYDDDLCALRLQCRPFSYFIYRFRKLYLEGGVIANESFRLQEATS